MNLLSTLFYVIAALVLATTALAITRRNLVYAVVYLVLSFFGTAMLFYLMGAPMLAALEVIIYAGAIMVLFLFIIMMIQLEKKSGAFFDKGKLMPALLISGLYLAAFAMLVAKDPDGWKPLAAAQALPEMFGKYLFNVHWLAIEIASMLLLVALIGAIVLGRRVKQSPENAPGERAS